MAHCQWSPITETTMQQKGLGSFINGSFVNKGTIALSSKNPSNNFAPVFLVKTDQNQVKEAVHAAKNALKSWSYLKQSERNCYLLRLKDSFKKHEEAISNAISLEMGKIKSESLLEAKSLGARIDLMLNEGLKRIKTEELYDLRAKTRYHSQGVLAVIGPYNFPAHLVNSHVIPSLMTGNTVVVKPSEVCPLTAEIYAQCFLEAEFPRGVYNMVQGDGAIGRALSIDPNVDGVLFTGSYNTGRALKEMLLDQPHKILALEMGGKNFAVVMDDADIGQALLEIMQGAFLTTGQRCTATSRVLVHEKIAASFIKALGEYTKKLLPSDAFGSGLFGPLATKEALEKFIVKLRRARDNGAVPVVESELLSGGAFVTPSLYQIAPDHPLDDYLGEELFGPNIALETFYDLDQAIKRVNESPFGLSNSIFTLDPQNTRRMYLETKSGVFNINRSTNGAYGQMPFGGVNKSGNQRPAGIDAVKYTTFPVAISELAYGDSQAPIILKNLLKEDEPLKTPLAIITLRHSIEAIFEMYGINSDFAAHDRLIFAKESFDHIIKHYSTFFDDLEDIFKEGVHFNDDYLVFVLNNIDRGQELIDKLNEFLQNCWTRLGLLLYRHRSLHINVPPKLRLPRSRAMLDRLYKGHFVPQEKKSPVLDLIKSKGSFLVSVDNDPLILFDAASQIATLGAGFYADTWQNAFECGELDLAIENTFDLAMENDGSLLAEDAQKAKEEFERFLHEKTHHRFNSIAYSAGGAEANEVAFDLCRQNGPGGTRIIAFEGAFHGRTIMSLQATYNKEKRGPFAFKGYEATFVPFPKMSSPFYQPAWSDDSLRSLAHGEIPKLIYADELLESELHALRIVKEEVANGDVCCVIIEPMQCEGGDNYASNRFFNGLRILTRALKTPLVFDEVQTGFHLGRSFFWHEQFDLKDHHGDKDVPDCVTLAKKAQLGVCMSVWKNPRAYTPHVLQLKRGLLHARAITEKKALIVEEKAIKELTRLQEYFPNLIQNPRAYGFAFAFDMPTTTLAMELINQRFDRGFMAYIAGEKTLRFRLNMCSDDRVINALFERIFIGLRDLRDGYSVSQRNKNHTHIHEPEHKAQNIAIEQLTVDNFPDYEEQIDALEKAAYEKERRDSTITLKQWIKEPDSLGLVLTCTIDNQKILGGIAIGGPLAHATSEGPQEDPMLKKHNTFYSADIAIDPRVRGMKLGRLLKQEQIKRVASMKKNDGTRRYLFISGRNRIQTASAMTHINQELGAYTINIYDHQYGDANAQALYYRLPIAKKHTLIKKEDKNKLIDCQNSVYHSFNHAASSFTHKFKQGLWRSLACQKITLSNWATTNMIRYSELLRDLMPGSLKHVYFTSGRDEVVDKGLRSLRYHRPHAEIAISFTHQWLGNISAAARSLSFDQGQAQPFSFFNWPKVSHPQKVGAEQSLKELKDLLNSHAPETILGIVIELLGEKSALYFEDSFLKELDAIRKSSDIPLIFVETTSAYGRTGRSLFFSDSLSVKPNMIWWFTGGQLGHVMVDDRYFVEKPLTLISTWDGDDMSMARAYEHLFSMSNPKNYEHLINFEESMKKLGAKGLGAWQGLKVNDKEIHYTIKAKAKKAGLLLGSGFDNTLMICPKPDSTKEELEQVKKIISSIV